MDGEPLRNCERLDLGLEPGTWLSVQGLAEIGGQLLVAVVASGPGGGGDREARILSADAATPSVWRTLFRVALPSDWVDVAGQRRRLTIAQGFHGFCAWPRPAAGGALSQLIALVSVQGSALIEVSETLEVRVHPNRSPEPGVPPLGRLFANGDGLLALAAAGRDTGEILSGSGSGHLYRCEDPAAAVWSPLWPGPAATAAGPVAAVAAAAGRLYLACTDTAAGFSLWSAPLAADGAVPAWAPVVDRGAFRFTLNAAVSAMVVHHDGCVYLATVAADGAGGLGNHGPEILRVDPAGGWEVIVGEARFTPAGLKRPWSGFGPGFDDRGAAAFTRLVATADGLLAIHQPQAPAGSGRACGSYAGPTRVWSSDNGVDWFAAEGGAVADLGEVQAALVTARGLLLGGAGVAAPDLSGASRDRQGSGAGLAPGALVLLPGFSGPRS